MSPESAGSLPLIISRLPWAGGVFQPAALREDIPRRAVGLPRLLSGCPTRSGLVRWLSWARAVCVESVGNSRGELCRCRRWWVGLVLGVAGGYPRRHHRMSEIGGGIPPFENRLPSNPDRRRGLADRVAFLQLSQDQPAAPVAFHGRRLPQKRPVVHMCGGARGGRQPGLGGPANEVKRLLTLCSH